MLKMKKNLTIAVDGKIVCDMYTARNVSTCWGWLIVQKSGFIHHCGLWARTRHEDPAIIIMESGTLGRMTVYKGDTVDSGTLVRRKTTVPDDRESWIQYIVDGSVFSEYKVLRTCGNEGHAPQQPKLPLLTSGKRFRVHRPASRKIAVSWTSAGWYRVVQPRKRNPDTLLAVIDTEDLVGAQREKWDDQNSEGHGIGRQEPEKGLMVQQLVGCIVQGAMDNDHGGLLQCRLHQITTIQRPLRIWPENPYDRGDMFANFS